MAWNKLPKNRPTRSIDKFDMEAEAEANAIRTGPQIIGPKGKKLKGGGRHDPRGAAIAEVRSLKRFEIKAA
jgi:hypothetical protein